MKAPRGPLTAIRRDRKAAQMNLPPKDRYVYLLFAPAATRPFYVGVGKDGTRRHLQHMRASRYEKANPQKNALLRWYRACGVEIRYEFPYEGLTLDEAYLRETELIALYGRRELGGCLFNLAPGGAGGRDPTPSTRARLAKAAAWHRGKKRPPCSLEHRAKLSAAGLGKKRSLESVIRSATSTRGQKRSAEFCAKIFARQLGKKRSAETIAKLRGRKFTLEHCAKMRAASRRRKYGKHAGQLNLLFEQ